MDAQAVVGNGEDPAIFEGLADMNAGLHATIGIQGALYSRTQDGEGRYVPTPGNVHVMQFTAVSSSD